MERANDYLAAASALQAHINATLPSTLLIMSDDDAAAPKIQDALTSTSNPQLFNILRSTGWAITENNVNRLSGFVRLLVLCLLDESD